MKVSIYTPTKNRKEALEKAVDSVLNQTYRDIELIVVSDGSTDGTDEYLKMRSQQDTRLKFFTKEKSEGAPAARNLAIKNATGHFVTGLDDDDEFLPQRIEAFVEYWVLLNNLGYKPACLFSQDIFTNNGEIVRTTKKRGLVTADDLFEDNFIGNQVFAPKSYFLEAGLFNESLPAWQDLEMFMRILKRFGTAHLLDCATQLYDDTPKSDRITLKGEKRVRDAYKIVVDIHATESKRDAQKLTFQMFAKCYGLRPGIKDWVQFFKLGFWPKGLAKLAVKTLRP